MGLKKKENEHLRSEIDLDYQALANRCWVLTQGSMCCFCDLSEFKCQHAMNDWQKTKATMKFIEE